MRRQLNVSGSADEASARAVRRLIEEHGSPLLVLDCERVRAQYRRLAAALPGVDLHYAMKALPHPEVLAALLAEGSSFDVSSAGELQLLQAMGVTDRQMVHTHPIKHDRDIRHAIASGCRMFVVDNAAELEKFVPYAPRVSLLLRVGFRSADAAIDLAKKYGCAPGDAFGLLEHAKRLGLQLCGLTFHVGSQCRTSRAHVDAIGDCRELMARARLSGLTAIRLLDIGGGFPASYDDETPDIESFCQPIRRALADLPADVRVIAEPGRFLAAPAMDGVATIVGKARRSGCWWYYLDDGVYGSFSGLIFDSVPYPVTVISASGGEPCQSVLAGPTCDSVDVLAEGLWLPELQIGDVLVTELMGAYTMAAASEFNSLPKTKILVRNAGMPLVSVAPTPGRLSSAG